MEAKEKYFKDYQFKADLKGTSYISAKDGMDIFMTHEKGGCSIVKQESAFGIDPSKVNN